MNTAVRRIVLAMSVIHAFACIPAWAAPKEGSVGTPMGGHVTPHMFSAPVFFHPPDPGIPVDVNPASTINIQPQITQPTITTPTPTQSTPTLNLPVLPANGIIPTDQLPFRAGTHAGRIVMNSAISRPPTVSVACLSDIHDGTSVPGWVLLRPLKNVTFTNEFGTFQVNAKARVLICAGTHSFTVYDVHDTKHGAVMVSCGSEHMRLLPGHQLTLTPDPKIAMTDLVIPHSKLAGHQVGNKMHALAGNFSIAVTMSMVRPLQNDAQVLKSAAIQHDVINYRE